MAGDLFNNEIDFLIERKKKVVLNGLHSKWSNIVAGVAERSILGPP